MKKSCFFAVMLLLFTVVSFQAAAQGFNSSYAVINAGTDVYYCMPGNTSCGSNPSLNGTNLGQFKQGSSSLILKGGQVNNYKCSGQDITSVRLNYRIYPTAGTPGSITVINLPFNSDFDNGCGGKDQQWQNVAANVDVLSGLTPGNYTIEFYCDQSTAAGTQYLSNSSNNYKASFSVYADFITRWNLATAGSGATQLSFGVATSGVVSYTWQELSPGTASGSGTFSGSSLTITGLPAGSIIRLNISPANFQRIIIYTGADRNRLTDVEQWGTTSWTSMANAFYGCSNLNISSADVPNLSGVSDMGYMFYNCASLNGPPNIGSWNTAAVTNMSYLFALSGFNRPIGNWNTANVTNMSSMFFYARGFNQPLGNWNTGSVTNMASMFQVADAFNQPIGTWNTAHVTDMNNMFFHWGANTFNQNLGSWVLNNNVNMTGMLSNSGMSCANYSATLIGWSKNALTPNGRSIGASGRSYNYAAQGAKDNLVNNKGWTISDAGIGAGSLLAATAGSGQVCQNTDVVSGKLYTDAGCNSLAMVTPNGASPVTGTVNTCVTIDAAVSTIVNGQPYLQRHFNITPSTNPSASTARITLYVLQAEFDAFNAARGAYPPLPASAADAAGKANLRITQYSGTGTAPGNYTPGIITFIDPDDADIVWNGYHWEISFNVTGFSGFYIHSPIFNLPLPVSLLSFSGFRNGSVNKLSWATASEQNNRGFAVERSTDGISYTALGFVNTLAVNGNSELGLVYSFTDSSLAGSKQYYRLQQVDMNGNSKLSNVIIIRGEKSNSLTIDGLYPNPASSIMGVSLSSPERSTITIQVIDMTGRVLIQQAKIIDQGNNTIQLNVAPLANGSYLLKIINSAYELVNSKFIKQ